MADLATSGSDASASKVVNTSADGGNTSAEDASRTPSVVVNGERTAGAVGDGPAAVQNGAENAGASQWKRQHSQQANSRTNR